MFLESMNRMLIMSTFVSHFFFSTKMKPVCFHSKVKKKKTNKQTTPTNTWNNGSTWVDNCSNCRWPNQLRQLSTSNPSMLGIHSKHREIPQSPDYGHNNILVWVYKMSCREKVASLLPLSAFQMSWSSWKHKQFTVWKRQVTEKQMSFEACVHW